MMDTMARFERFSPRMLIGLGTPLLLVMMLGMMILPLPTPVLDLVFTFNIALGLIVLLVAVYTLKPLNLPSSRQYCWWPRCCGCRSMSHLPASSC